MGIWFIWKVWTSLNSLVLYIAIAYDNTKSFSDHHIQAKHVQDFALHESIVFAENCTALNNASSFRVHNPNSHTGVKLHVHHKFVTIDNGILKLVLSKPGGVITGIQYNDVDNLMEVKNKADNRGFWSIVWSEPGSKGKFDVIKGTKFEIIHNDDDQVEVSFVRTWNPSLRRKIVPLNIDRRFIMLRGSSGFYSYGIFEHLEGWPDFSIAEARIAFKLRGDMFHYMALSDDRQRIMPLVEDRMEGRSEPLAYKEAVRLVNPSNPDLKGEVDDKYQYSQNNKDNQVHGWISSQPLVGFWLITPSHEFKTGGPFMQDLTSHVGPTTLAMFTGTHYSGVDLVQSYSSGEQWKKVFGPVFTYVNSHATSRDQHILWEDAKYKMKTEVKSWPYNFPRSKDYQTTKERGSVTGKLFVSERLINKKHMPADSAYVGLALPGEAGSWQRESKGYQFWTRTDKHGHFRISNIRTGKYNLYAYVPGFIGDFKMGAVITIYAGSSIRLGDVVYEPPRDGHTIWEIGIPDRTAAEFFIPDPNPHYINKLYVNHHDKFRQYGLWERYKELYPNRDLVYTVGESNYTKDWFFAQVTREVGQKRYVGTTWQVRFRLKHAHKTRPYMLRVALASSSHAELQVRINDLSVKHPHFTTGTIGQDNAVARHGIHGLYRLYSIDVSKWVTRGFNIIYFTQPKCTGPFEELLYDYIRLEGPSSIIAV